MTEPAPETGNSLARIGADLGNRHAVHAAPPRPVPVWSSLDALTAWLDDARSACRSPPAEAAKAAEWLLDNEYHVRRAIRQVRSDMPPAFYRLLPSLAAPEYHGLPRIYAAACGYLAATHAQIGLPSATRFVTAYQSVHSLQIAELWAFPAMLRLACLETIILTLSELLPGLEPPFSELPLEPDTGKRDATEAMSRAIVALAALTRIDWKDFVEATSVIEEILRDAPDGTHALMDFETRDLYRRAVEELARGSGCTEPHIAREVVRLSGTHAGAGRQMHAGWWLVGRGRAELEAILGYRARAGEALRRRALARPGWLYAAGLLGFGAMAILLPMAFASLQGAGAGMLVLTFVILLIPASIMAVTLTNWIVTRIVPPRILPKMDFRDGLPDGLLGAVIVPVILHSPEEVPPLIAQLERHWLTNPDPRLRFTLLSDFADATEEAMPGDTAIEAALLTGIRSLNTRHGEGAPFVLLHRHRRWNGAEDVWMGWERKRGKIEEFNEFLHGEANDAFALAEGDVDSLRHATFVVTLDADTQAPQGSVQRLLGTLAHPLNRTGFDSTGERVVDGYTFIQPRIEISPEIGASSLFARLYTGDTAIDIYSRAVSDVYQDLFGEAIFTGKGAYDPAAFRQSLHRRVPENALVSHDLFEGLHGRTGLASDIVLYEGFPARYPDFARRQHRWIRGDWQLLPWLGRHAPGRGGIRLRNPLSRLDRWKILDNLRRSLIAPALVLMAVLGWLLQPQAALFWTFLTILAPASYLFTNVISGISRGRRRGTVQDRRRQFLDHAGRWVLEIIFMANEAIVSLDAIARTLWRLMVSRQRMLEWVTAAQIAAASTDSRARFWREMAGAPILAIAIVTVLFLLAPAAVPGAMPLLLLWGISPEIARFIGRPRRAMRETISNDDRVYLRHLARHTWAYFETLAGPEDNWLPPDNYQAAPHEEVAHRSSPTNVGMMLLSTLAAHDFGYSGTREVAARVSCVLDALGQIEHYRGHVVNWFDTRTLEPLEPRYVSTVDSGNLAVALLTLREGLLEAMAGPALLPVSWDGLADTLDLLRGALEKLPEDAAATALAQLDATAEIAKDARAHPARWHLEACRIRDGALANLSRAIPPALDAADGADPHDIHLWLERCQHHVHSMVRDLEAFCPWLAPGAVPGGLAAQIANELPPVLPMEKLEHTATSLLKSLEAAELTATEREALSEVIRRGIAAQADLHASLKASADRAEQFATAMDFSFLYDPETRTFFIGYNLSVDQMDEHRYDLLASEARLASYLAIAKRDVPAEHWFHLGRPLSRDYGMLTVLSWNGSMFEYLMPALLLRSVPGQLLGQSEIAAVDIQIHYGQLLGLPWGVSEAAFATRDAAHRYQYRAFGVAGLGLKQGLSDDYVVAPYASALALAVRPNAAINNLRRLERMGVRGHYGFFDSVDFTPSRRDDPPGYTPVRNYMAHHQGMLLSAVCNALCNDILVQRFNRDRRISANDLLLHERVPWEYIPEPLPDAGADLPDQESRPVPELEGWPMPDNGEPQLHTVGNGRLSLWLSDTGCGTLWWHGKALTRWVADPLRDEGSAGLFLRDAADGTAWDFRRRPQHWVDVMLHPAKASLHMQHHEIAATQEITVAAADDVEIRRITLINQSDRPREIEVTDYAEPVLDPDAAYERHPAFSKLFVHSEHVEALDGLLFTRRPRRLGEAPPVMLRRLITEDPSVQAVGFESDRRALLGRHGSSARACASGRALSGRTGWTLDPVSALRVRVQLASGARAQFAFMTIASGSRETALEVASRYKVDATLDWAFTDAARSANIEANRLGIGQVEMEEGQQLANRLVRPPTAASVRADEQLPSQSDLWGLGLSGDHPIILLRVPDAEHADLLPAIVGAHRWLRRHDLPTDLVVLGTTASSYEAPISTRLRDTLREIGLGEGLGGKGGVHLHSVDRLSATQLHALESFARLDLDGSAATIAVALPTLPSGDVLPPLFKPGGIAGPETAVPLERPDGLLFDNGYGGFAADGESYVIHLAPGQRTPVPWCNVLANEQFGTIVSEAGLGFTWSLNSGEHRLTPWSNDPVEDGQGEALYLRDEETGEIWTMTQLPVGDGSPVQIRHGAGTTTWARNSKGIAQRLCAYVPPNAPVKLVRLTLTNAEARPRRITATYYARWQLGALESMSAPHVVCGYNATARALVARNGWAADFAGRVAFLTANRPPHSLSCDRTAFLGPDASAIPEGLRRWNLGGRTDVTGNACAAFQVHLDLPPEGAEEVVFVLGDAANPAEMEKLAARWTREGSASEALEATRALWNARLGAVRVETPEPAFDLMVNRWLPYQTWASRILARAGFSQAGGGIGFRDQLQDVMAILHSDPAWIRSHILDCAAHQFEEGDVLHWWHPPTGRGVRTRCSDDLMWLVLATHRYVTATGDESILAEEVPYLSAPPLAENEEDRYASFLAAAPGSIFDHCRRAMERGVTAGRHGLPLIGAGDWNDGMDRIGHHGRGESVWLAWFASVCSDGFADLAARTGRTDLADLWHGRAGRLRHSAETAAWDSNWFVRAFDDDGEPWGSARNDECRIDSIAQSWSVLSGSADMDRAAHAIRSAAEHLVDRNARLVRLLAPPFDQTPRDPGYIRAYPPGIRENGGQYTHAATWLGLAFARLGDGNAAHEIFDLINPVRRSETATDAENYRAEPYVMPADVGGAPPFEGRAGWTWYTGAAGWAWRLGVEGILGLDLREGKLRVAPCLPDGWGRVRALVKGPRGVIDLEILNETEAGQTDIVLEIDGRIEAEPLVEFPEDGSVRSARVIMQAASHARTCEETAG
ncbi:GH36-type glycosyl hydrolase domain-containing protein [Aliiruegeria lutimaris]|uniref:Cyclic beta-1,2-glucan synthetase n=1 Tax=Aliiruegeria lutimaris TaxID=571298 RepID=A0A1G8QRZ8_9RHOB|nr:glucoamylase family protein [Aliiruegeria lutimaris]SDJ07529.1 cyclic beta-1,2-glucan synthetase [Aliiruegeria lutimaris]